MLRQCDYHLKEMFQTYYKAVTTVKKPPHVTEL